MGTVAGWVRWVPVCVLLAGACDRFGGPEPWGPPPGAGDGQGAGGGGDASVAATADAPPIAFVGHGSFFNADGKAVEPAPALIRATQRYHIKRLEASEGAANVRAKRELIVKLVRDPIVADALYVDALLAAFDPENEAQIASVNNATRWHYLLETLKLEPPAPGKPWAKGVDPQHVDELERNGVPVLLSINSGGAEYRDACRAAGVPVPEAMYSEEWVNRGTFDDEFISGGLEAELWTYESTSPPGVCLALPRYPSDDPGRASLFGIICLGTQSSKACFFDNPRGVRFARGVEEPLSSWVGGTDLVPNGQGVCSDCHAGENPYVVHPEKKPFASLLAETSIKPLSWYDPLVDASWPQNPGPTSLLAGVGSAGRCDNCHRAGASAGRFPELSGDLPGYCSAVFENAVRGVPPGTMPPFGLDQSQYAAHIEALRNACRRPRTKGEVVPVDAKDDGAFLSPPQVVGPLYQCATQVAVRGRLNAKLVVRVNGSDVDGRVVRDPGGEVFAVPDLVAGDRVTAIQEYLGVVSAESAPEVVRDHRVDFPAGLPAPTIDPALIYECAETIAVQHVPGAKLTVYSDGGDPRTISTSTGYSVGYPARVPFTVGEEFTAEISLCGDKSPLSAPQRAVGAPATMPAPAFDPPETYVGQELLTLTSLVNGAFTKVSEASAGGLGEIYSWPVSWYPNYDVATPLGHPLLSGETIYASQRLCSSGPENKTPPARRCEALPPPIVSTPVAGQDFVVVNDAVPGASVRVYDAGGVEIGDGAAPVVVLRRALTGSDVITVVQQVGECTSRTGYRVRVVERRGQ
jgi:hypothetical protein